MKLIPHWRKALRLSSVQIAMIIAAIGALQAGLHDLGFSERTYALINTGLAVFLAVARIIAQPEIAPTAGPVDAQQDGAE